MFKVEKRLKEIDELISRLNSMLEQLTANQEKAHLRYEECDDLLNKFTYQDAYRQVKAECTICQRHLDDVRELRDMVAHYGDKWELRQLLRKHEKYVTSWERMRSILKEGGTEVNG